MSVFVELHKMPIVKVILSEAAEKIMNATGREVQIIITGPAIKESFKSQLKTKVKKWVADAFGFHWEDIAGPVRKPSYVEARAVYVYLMCRVVENSFTETGIDVNRDHSSALHLVTKAESWYRSLDRQHNAYLVRHLEAIKKMIEEEAKPNA